MTDNNRQVETTKITDLTPDPQNTNGMGRSIEYLPLAELITRLHPENAKEHNIGQIIESFKTHSYVASGVIDSRTGLFLAGHGRIIALNMMKKQGMDAPGGIRNGGEDWLVPVQTGYASKNDMQAKAYLVADNRLTTLGGWNEPALAELLQELANSDEIDIEASGYDSEDLDQLLRDLGNTDHVEEPPEAQMDKAAELNKKWNVELGQLWSIGEHKLLCGDSTDSEHVNFLMSGVKADAVITDPPYGVTQNKWDAIIPFEYMWDLFDKHIKYDGAIVLTASQPFSSKLVMSNLEYFRYEWIGHKSRSTGFLDCEKRPLRAHESILIFAKTQPYFNPQMVEGETHKVNANHHRASNNYGAFVSTGERYTNSFYPTSVIPMIPEPSIAVTYKHRPEKIPTHPTQKSTDFISYFIKTYTIDNEVVVDICLGSGTTMVAAQMTDRTCYGLEIDPGYCAVILERMTAMGLEATLIDCYQDLTPERTTK